MVSGVDKMPTKKEKEIAQEMLVHLLKKDLTHEENLAIVELLKAEIYLDWLNLKLAEIKNAPMAKED